MTNVWWQRNRCNKPRTSLRVGVSSERGTDLKPFSFAGMQQSDDACFQFRKKKLKWEIAVLGIGQVSLKCMSVNQPPSTYLSVCLSVHPSLSLSVFPSLLPSPPSHFCLLAHPLLFLFSFLSGLLPLFPSHFHSLVLSFSLQIFPEHVA